MRLAFAVAFESLDNENWQEIRNGQCLLIKKDLQAKVFDFELDEHMKPLTVSNRRKLKNSNVTGTA
jgi:hypothetical protein